MNIKDKATNVRRLQEDEAFNMLVEDVREDAANVFLNPYSSKEEREEAHHLVRALAKFEDRMAQILTDEAIHDRNERRSGPWKRLMN